MFEEFPPEPFSTESSFPKKIREDSKYIKQIIDLYAPNHPITKSTSKESELIYKFWKKSQQLYGGGGRIIFPKGIRKQITSVLQKQLESTMWTVMMHEEYLGDV